MAPTPHCTMKVPAITGGGIVVNGKNALLFASDSTDNEAVGIQINKTATNFVMAGGVVDGFSVQGVGIELNQVSGAVF